MATTSNAAGPAAATTPLLGRYRIERELGSGGMAVVYLAEDVRHHRKVAVKVLRPELSTTLTADRFLREIEISAQLLHPHILTLIDSGDADGTLFYVMPYVPGESLRARLDRTGELPIGEAVRVIRAVADALAYAHQRGVVHRDIKPENVLMLSDVSPDKAYRSHALVADFGIAKAVRAAAGTSGDHSITSLGMAVGTPAYMAPEQAAGDPQVDRRADIYALGVLAYEVLAGSPPFSGSTPQQVMAAHVARTPEPLSKRRAAVPPKLEHIVMRCLEKRPADRWQTADELLQQLDTVSLSHVGPATPATTTTELVDTTFRLSENVCRLLTRATLDARMIGDVVHYRDNRVESDVLVLLVPGCGLDYRDFEPFLRRSPYRAVAITQYGFEPTVSRRIPLSVDDHGTIIRALLWQLCEQLEPSCTILAGFSSGADLVLRLLAVADPKPDPRVDGVLSLACNLGIETCFSTQGLAQLSGDPARVLAHVQQVGRTAQSLDAWLKIHEYLVKIMRKFHGDIAPLRQFAADITAPFERPGENAFVEWYRAVSARVRCVRCVFDDDDSGTYERLLRDLRLRNLDERILGEHYSEDSLVLEPGVNHFDLVQPDRILGYLESIVAELTR